MATMTQYNGPCELQFDGRTLAEATTCRISVTPNTTPVRTMKKGLGGRSRGPVECTIDVESAIPKAGFEVDFMQKCIDDADVTIVIVRAGKRVAFDSFITNVAESYGVQAAASSSFSAMSGRPRKY